MYVASLFKNNLQGAAIPPSPKGLGFLAVIRMKLGRPGINLFNPHKILLFLWLFLLVLPKGGIKLAGIPITWGYLLLGATFFFSLFRKTWKIQAPRLESLLCLLPFQFISLLTMAINGVENIGMAISFFLSFFFLPFAFFLVFSNDIETLDLQTFFDLLTKGITFISCYGIVLFFFKQITGRFIEIPLLTTNWGDLGLLETKNINRGSVFKLISTYNNGNIFGVCLLILLPVYCFLEKGLWKKIALKSALFLTLSRTVWIGLLFNEILYDLWIEKKKKFMIAKMLLSLLIIFSALFLIAQMYGFHFSFFFDLNLGGRNEQIEEAQQAKWFSDLPFAGIYEVVYVCMIRSFGVAGCIGYLIAITAPLFLNVRRQTASPLRRCLILGILNYLFISMSDGALLFIPTMVFYWFLASLLARTNLDAYDAAPARFRN